MNDADTTKGTVAVSTLGCKANQYESGRLAADFASRGFRVVADPANADIIVVNTCTVTNVADTKSRHQIRRLKRRHPNATVVATGCAAEIDPDGIRAATGADLVIPNRGKAGLVGAAMDVRPAFPTLREDAIPENVDDCRLPSLGRTRALLMVQDGCGYGCSYCIIPTARPVRVSRDFDALIAEAEDLAAAGYREIVLTGISIGSWRCGHKRLHQLVRRLAEVGGVERIRMSSIEPRTVSLPLIEALADLPQGCHHFHIPLQAGDDGTLRDMNRFYDTSYFARLVDRIRVRMPDAAISTDVITGFPTETEAQFKNTHRFCEEVDFCKIHVFPFSPRAGTPAAALEDIAAPARRERTARLIGLSDEGARRWAERHVGQTVSVLAEPVDQETVSASGLTGNYVRVHWPSDGTRRGQLVDVHLTGVKDGVAYGAAA